MSELKSDMISTDTIDVEAFIAEVKNYPVIWDLNCQENRYKTKKLAAWEQIARKFFTNLDERSALEKMDFYRRLHGKWRNIRDSYVRCIKRGKPKRGYMYARYLSFLNNLYNVTCSTDDDDHEDGSEEDASLRPKRRLEHNDANMWPSDIDDNTTATDNTRKRRRIRKEDEPFDTAWNYQMEDEDRSFFESLLPAVREFNLDQKLEFRSEVLRLVKSIRCNDMSSVFVIKSDPGDSR